MKTQVTLSYKCLPYGWSYPRTPKIHPLNANIISRKRR